MKSFSIDEIRPFLLNKKMTDQQIIKYLGELQQAFNRRKNSDQDIKSYSFDESTVSAYSSFYFPTNFVKFEWAMNLLPQLVRDALGETELIDFGTGPGTFSLAWLNYFEDASWIYFVDQSELMLRQAESFKNGLFPAHKQVTYCRELKEVREGKKKRTLLFGHSLNEIENEQAYEIVKQIKPEHILIFEPGTSASFKDVLQFREKMLENGYHIHYPCHQNTACPMKEEDWCHQVLRVVHEASIERISQMSKIDRRTMPLIFQVYSKVVNKPAGESGRIVQFLRETKFSFDYRICHDNEIFEAVLMKKQFSKKEMKQLKTVNVGESLFYEKEKSLGPQKFRIKLVGDKQ